MTHTLRCLVATDAEALPEPLLSEAWAALLEQTHTPMGMAPGWFAILSRLKAKKLIGPVSVADQFGFIPALESAGITLEIIVAELDGMGRSAIAEKIRRYFAGAVPVESPPVGTSSGLLDRERQTHRYELEQLRSKYARELATMQREMDELRAKHIRELETLRESYNLELKAVETKPATIKPAGSARPKMFMLVMIDREKEIDALCPGLVDKFWTAFRTPVPCGGDTELFGLSLLKKRKGVTYIREDYTGIGGMERAIRIFCSQGTVVSLNEFASELRSLKYTEWAEKLETFIDLAVDRQVFKYYFF